MPAAPRPSLRRLWPRNPVYWSDSWSGLHHKVVLVGIAVRKCPGLVIKVGHRNVEPPRHQTFEESQLVMVGVALKNRSRGAGEEAIEGRTVLTEAAELA